MREIRGLDTISSLRETLDSLATGRECYEFIRRVFPICRSITGNGFRQTLAHVQEYIPVQVHEVPTGTQVFDWTVPREWNIRDAYVKNFRGERVIDFQKSNLHVVNYSVPASGRMRLQELRQHLFSLPHHPDWIPYKTSYYNDSWGFCVSHRQLEEMSDDEYEFCIDSTLENGSLTYGELLIPGGTEDEVLISSHACHPSLCNDNLSGVAVATFLAKLLTSLQTKYSYRFLFIPGTIGSIAWLSRNEKAVRRIKHGLVLSCVGDPGKLSYKKSRSGDSEIDRAALHALQHSASEYAVADFSPYGNDERQYSSPGFDLPVGRLSRTPDGQFPEYHTSADNLDFVDAAALGGSLRMCLSIFEILEGNGVYENQNPKCEPQLGKRGLYRAIGGYRDQDTAELAILWVLNQSDGSKSLLSIAERSKLSFTVIRQAADVLERCGLLAETPKKANDNTARAVVIDSLLPRSQRGNRPDG